MSKSEPKKRTTLTAGEYWQWRNTITEKWLADAKLNARQLELKVMSREAEMAQMRMQLHRQAVDACVASVEAAKQVYDETKAALEAKLGFSLNGKLIDDVTFEIKEIEDDAKPKHGEKN